MADWVRGTDNYVYLQIKLTRADWQRMQGASGNSALALRDLRVHLPWLIGQLVHEVLHKQADALRKRQGGPVAAARAASADARPPAAPELA